MSDEDYGEIDTRRLWTGDEWKPVKCSRLGYSIETHDKVVVGTEDEEGRYGAIANQQDASLIAAAPDLYEALWIVLEARGVGSPCLSGLDLYMDHDDAQFVRNALLKACGRYNYNGG
jgi:hypothetical protein